MPNTWQLYDRQGRAIPGKAASKPEVVFKGLLHASAHVWLWRASDQDIEVLVQKRSTFKVTWPGHLDKSAGGHIRAGEQAVDAVVRKANEELNLTLQPSELQFIGATYNNIPVENLGITEHEYQWIFTSELGHQEPTINYTEVDSITWKKLSELRAELLSPQQRQDYVPYPRSYCILLIEKLEKLKEATRLRHAQATTSGQTLDFRRAARP